MSDYCVVVVGGTRARFFTLAPVEHPEFESGPNLVEAGEDIINTEIDVPGRLMFSDAKSGRNMGGGGAGAHGYDDHRDQHFDEFKRRFARLVADEAVSMAERNKARSLVLAAEKQMLGFLRAAISLPSKVTFEVREVAKDLSRFTPQEIQGHLAAEGLLPARTRRA